ncbi:MAG: hypothetical protein ACO1TE_21725 [Prosthecobacter sp.]
MKSLPFLLLIACSAPAADTVDKVNAMLKAGTEAGWIVRDSTDANEDLAVLFTSRLKDSKPADFPALISEEILPRDTLALDEDTHLLENIVVSLKQKRVIGRVVPPPSEKFQVYFPNRNHGSLGVLWGPEKDGRRLSLLLYGAKWDSPEVLLIESGGGKFRQASIKPLLDQSTHKFIGGGVVKDLRGVPATDYLISYQPITDPAQPAADSSIKIAFSAEVPKSDVAPSLEGTLTVRLENSAEKLSAKVLKVEPATPQ